MAKTPLDRLDAGAFGMLELPRLAAAILEGFRALGDLTGTTSDALDERRIAGVVPGSTLRPTDPTRRTTWPSRAMITGKWRIRTVAVNRPVSIAGVSVNPGDLVIADEVGVCFVPFERAAEVLEVAQRLAQREAGRLARLASGMPLKPWLES